MSRLFDHYSHLLNFVFNYYKHLVIFHQNRITQILTTYALLAQKFLFKFLCGLALGVRDKELPIFSVTIASSLHQWEVRSSYPIPLR